MNRILSLALLAMFFAIPAHAQRSMAGTLGPNGQGYIPGGVGGSGSAAGGPGSAISGAVQFQTLPPIPPALLKTEDVSGTRADFIPSSWTDFERGLARGRAELNAERKTLAEIAAENRQVEKPHARFTLIQDANGKPIIERQ